MANPNIASATNLTGKTVIFNLTTTNATGIVTNSTSSNQIIKLNTLRATNINGANPADITVSFYDSSATTTGYLAYTISVVADATLNILDKTESIYLEEGDFIQATCSSANYISICCSYEVIQ
jgi:hypothetical protein